MKKKCVFLGFLIVLTLFVGCIDDEGTVISQKDLLIGKWSILSATETDKDSGGSVLDTDTETFEKNWNTVEFKEDGTMLVIDVGGAEWAEGTFTFDEEAGVITTELDNENEEISLSISAITATASTLEFTDTFEDGGETFTREEVLILEKNDGTEPSIAEEDLINKWSFTAQEVYEFLDVNEDGEFDETTENIFSLELSNIPYNRFSIEFENDKTSLNIDTFLNEVYSDGDTWEMLDDSNIVITDDEGGKMLVHVMKYDDPVFEVYVAELGEGELDEDTFDLKVEGIFEFAKNDGSETTIDSSVLFDVWKITGFESFKNGQEVEPGDDDPTGATLVLNSDGTGLLGFGGESSQDLIEVKLLDESNFTFTIEGDEEGGLIVLNVVGYDAAEGVLEVVQGRFDFGDDSVVVEENRITLIKVEG